MNKIILDPFKSQAKDEQIYKPRPLIEWLLKGCIDGDKLTFTTNERGTEIVNDRTNSRYVILRRKNQ